MPVSNINQVMPSVGQKNSKHNHVCQYVLVDDSQEKKYSHYSMNKNLHIPSHSTLRSGVSFIVDRIVLFLIQCTALRLVHLR